MLVAFSCFDMGWESTRLDRGTPFETAASLFPRLTRAGTRLRLKQPSLKTVRHGKRLKRGLIVSKGVPLPGLAWLAFK